MEEELIRNPKKIMYIVDDNIAIKRNHLLEVVRVFNKRGIRYSLEAPLAVFIEDQESFDGELLAEMSKNCLYVFTGIEDLTKERIEGARDKKGIGVVQKAESISDFDTKSLRSCL